jgi:beta-lactamase class A
MSLRSVRLAVSAVLVLAALGGCRPDEATAPSRPQPATTTSSAPSVAPSVARDLDRLETEFDVRLGLYALDTGSGREIEHRADERFAFCSTPRAIAGDLRAYVLGDALPATDRTLPTGWLRTNTTGDELVRAGVPRGWVVGDKTGSGGYGARNDIAVVWPPHRAPIVLAIMSTHDTVDAEYDDALIARAARTAVTALTTPR